MLFIEASREFREGSAQNHLREEDVTKIAAAFHAFRDVEKYARVVSLDEIAKNDFNLNISRYVEAADAADSHPESKRGTGVQLLRGCAS